MTAEQQKQEASFRRSPTRIYLANPNTFIGTSIEDYTQLFVHLFNIGHMLCGQTQGELIASVTRLQ